MRLTAVCTSCLRGSPAGLSASTWTCCNCGGERPLKVTAALRDENRVEVCAVCGCGHFYVEKDFNGYLGAAILFAAIVGSGILWASNVIAALGLLAGATLADAALWFVVRDRTICYKCLSIYRGAAKNPGHRPYDLGTAGRFTDDYEEEKARHS